jgi:hypothetical protein
LAFGVVDLQHVLQRQRLEVEPIGGVVVGRDRLGVAVDHDGLVARLAQRHGGVHAGVVELDALADAVRARSQDQRAQRLLQRLGERAADGHRLADRLHLGAEHRRWPGNFSNAQRGTLVTT